MIDLVRRKRALVIICVLFFLFIFISSIFPSLFPEWTGLPERVKSDTLYPAKTFWDWLDLFLIPLFLAVGAFLLNRAENERRKERENEEKYQKNLDTYITQMTNLLLSPHPFSRSGLQVARTLTLTVLPSVDEEKKQLILQFLYESGFLLQDEYSILKNVDLSGLKLRGLNLKGANLSGINFSRTDMEGSVFSLANLRGAMLEEAVLSRSDLIEADLQKAHLTKAKLRAANLTYAKMKESFCEGAVFYKANLANADFTGADLRDADFNESRREGANFTDIIGGNIPL